MDSFANNFESIVDLRDIIGLATRKAYFIAGFILVCTALLASIIPSMQDTYTAAAALVLERKDTQLLETVIKLEQEEHDRSALDTEIDVMSSRVFAGQVVDATKLIENPWFNTFLAASSDLDEATALRRLLATARDKIFGLFGLGGGRSAQFLPDGAIQRDRTVTSFLENLKATRTPNSYVVTVHVTSPDPGLSARLANAVVERYVDWSRELRQQAARDAIDFLRERANELASRIARSERAMDAFARVNKLAPDQRDDLLRARIVEMNTQLTAAWVELSEIRAGRVHGERAINGEEGIDGSPLDSPILVTLQGEQALLIRQRAQYASNFGAAHPQVAETDAQLASVAQMIDDERGRIVQGQSAEERVVSDRIGRLEAQIASMQQTLRDHRLAEVRLRELERDLLGDQKLHERVVARQGGLDPIATLAKPRARVVSLAETPTDPNFPRKTHLLAVGGVGSAIVALIIAVLLEAVDARIRSAQRVVEVTALPNLASIPKLSKRVLKCLAETPNSIAAEAFRSLHLALRAVIPDAGGIVLVTAPLPRSGTTSVAFGLALAAARDGARTLSIAFRRDAVELAALAQIAGEEDFEAKLGANGSVRPVEGLDGLHALAVGRAGSRGGSEADRPLGAQDLRRLLARFRAAYDLIVIDAAPVLLLEDASWLSPLVDAELLVVRFATTQEEELADAISRLRLSGAPLVGTVLNAVEPHGYTTDTPLIAASRPRLAKAYFSD